MISFLFYISQSLFVMLIRIEERKDVIIGLYKQIYLFVYSIENIFTWVINPNLIKNLYRLNNGSTYEQTPPKGVWSNSEKHSWNEGQPS